MATCRVWALHGNVQRAIDYIINKDKTEEGMLVEGKNCLPEKAGYLWKAKEQLKPGYTENKEDIVGFHFQISFKADGITPDEVQKISKEWIEKVTGGNFDYVMATHVDHQFRKNNPHIHTHFVVRPRSNVDDKKLQIFYKRDLPHFKEIADRLCVEHGHKVLTNPKGFGKTYYEMMMEEQGDSLKDVIAKTIDTVIPKVRDYDEFKQYLTKLGYEVEDGLDKKEHLNFEFHSDISLLSNNLFDDKNYFIRLPGTTDYVSIPKTSGRWTNNDKTFVFKVPLEETFTRYDKDGNIKVAMKGENFKNYFEQKENQNERTGLRIKAPHSKKFIRCHRIDVNENGEGYSLNNVFERIESNGRLYPDPEVTSFINGTQANNDMLNKFYEEADIRTKWKNSQYYRMMKKEQTITRQVNELQLRLNAVHERRIQSDDIFSLNELKLQRKELQNELKKVNVELNKQEMYCEQIGIDRLAERLEVSDKEFDEFIATNVTPLKESKQKLKDEISALSVRINKAEHIKNKHNTKR